MKIQIKSDLHFEQFLCRNSPLTEDEKSSLFVSPETDVLVLAGDIINANDQHADFLINELKDCQVPILYVPGNHEYWHGSFLKSRDFLKEKFKDTNITLLNRDWNIIKNKAGESVLFIGATLWTSLTHPIHVIIAKDCPDFKLIKDLNPEIWTNKYIEEYHFISQALSHPEFEGMKKVVITHYLPSYFSVPTRFKDNEANCIFVAQRCEELMQDEYSPELWIHGHTHDSNDYTLYNTRVVSNPKGRGGRDTNKTYNNELIIEI